MCLLYCSYAHATNRPHCDMRAVKKVHRLENRNPMMTMIVTITMTMIENRNPIT